MRPSTAVFIHHHYITHPTHHRHITPLTCHITDPSFDCVNEHNVWKSLVLTVQCIYLICFFFLVSSFQSLNHVWCRRIRVSALFHFSHLIFFKISQFNIIFEIYCLSALLHTSSIRPSLESRQRVSVQPACIPCIRTRTFRGWFMWLGGWLVGLIGWLNVWFDWLVGCLFVFGVIDVVGVVGWLVGVCDGCN